MPEMTITGKEGNTTILPAIKFQQLSDGDADLLNMFIDTIGDARLRDVSFSINSKIGAAGNFDFNKKLISINQKHLMKVILVEHIYMNFGIHYLDIYQQNN